MLKNIWKKLKERLSPQDEHEPFVTFIQVAREDPDLRKSMLAILKKDDFNRESILNTFIEELRFKGAPESFVSCLACLLDRNVARQAVAILESEDSRVVG
jgi:hypothetical protein